VGILSSLDAFVGRGSSRVVAPGVRPGGRLSLTTGVPITTTDVASSTIDYVPYVHDTIQLWDSRIAQWVMVRFVAPSVTLGAGNVAGTCYDLYAYLSNNAVALELGPVWTNPTTRATDVQFTDGRITKVGDKTRLLVGSIYVSVTASAVDSVSSRYLANAYNRVPRTLLVQEATDSWTYVGVVRQANNSVLNQVGVMVCQLGEPIEAEVLALVTEDGSAVTRTLSAGIGVDSTTVNSALLKGGMPAGTAGQMLQLQASWIGYLAVGRHFLAWVERASGAGVVTWYGDNNAAGFFQSGLRGTVWA
jgi:hypothetical protein